MKRYFMLLGSALAVGLVLMIIARTVHMPAPAVSKVVDVPSVELALTLTMQGISP